MIEMNDFLRKLDGAAHLWVLFSVADHSIAMAPEAGSWAGHVERVTEELRPE